MTVANVSATERVAAFTVDRAGFDALAPQWPALLHRTGHDAPFFTHEFLGAWLDAFAHGETVRVICVRDSIGLRAALPLVERHETLYGIQVVKLAGAANVHSARFDLIAHAEDSEAIAAVWSQLADLEWDVLELPDVPPQGAARELLALAKKHDDLVGEWESMQTPFIPLEGGFEAVMQRQLSAKFRSNLRRRRKKLLEHGAVELVRVTGGADLGARLAEGFALEAAGWKGREGTAIANDASTREFYQLLAQRLTARGELSLYFLKCGGRAVAFYYSMTHAGICYLPKLGFDESLAQASPGHLILEDVLADCCARGIREFDFLGPNMPWKSEWTSQVRVHHWLYIFKKSLRGRAVHAAKFKVGPKVKEALAWKP